MSYVIEMNGVVKNYLVGQIVVQAVRGVDFHVHTGEFVAIMGASGSGKSTLMNLIGCLDKVTEGQYRLDGIDIESMSSDQLADVRNEKIGFVFQSFNLLPRLTALENVEVPLYYNRKTHVKNPGDFARRSLEMVGLGDRIHHEPRQLSGGQQQRVAIARALVNDPALILADEPTGALDTKTSVEMMALLQHLNALGKTIVVVTHEPDIAQYAKRVVRLSDGIIISDEPVKNRTMTVAVGEAS